LKRGKINIFYFSVEDSRMPNQYPQSFAAATALGCFDFAFALAALRSFVVIPQRSEEPPHFAFTVASVFLVVLLSFLLFCCLCLSCCHPRRGSAVVFASAVLLLSFRSAAEESASVFVVACS